MKKLLTVFVLVTVAVAVVALGSTSNALGQTPSATAPTQGGDPGITANGVIGEVAAVDAGAKQMFVKTDAGSVVVVAVADNTVFMRVPPGESTLDKATRVTLAEVSAGDRVFARGKPSDDRKTVAARMVIVNTKAELTQKQERERAEWKRRGVVGVISALNPQTKEITLQTRGAAGSQTVTVVGSADTKFRRYAPDSVKFSDAKPGTFEQLQVGDQLRAKGDKSEDGARFTAEEIVTGSFRTVVGTITAVAADQNLITIKTLQGNQPLTVVVSKDSMLKRVPAEFATMMGGGGGAGAPGGGAGGGAAAAQPGGSRQGTPSSGAGAATGERRGGMRGGDMQEMLERLPSTTVAELEPGRMIVFSTTGTDAARVTAIQLVAGVEPLVAMMQGGRPGGGGGRGAGGGGGGGAGGGGGITFGFGIGAP